MTERYKPMLAKTAEAPFRSKDWIFEIKWDGIRAISYVGSDLEIRTRNNTELRQNFPELEELKNLTENTVLDGEIVVIKNGKPDFQRLIERSRSASALEIEYSARDSPATYIVFDILEKEGEPLINLPLTERKRILNETLREGHNVVHSMFAEEEGEVYYEAAIQKGLEGIIAKKKTSQYAPGTRSDDWLKIKRTATCDCAIFGYTRGKGERQDTFGALILGLYASSGKPVYVGKVGIGFSRETMQKILSDLKGLKEEEKTLQNVDAEEEIVWLKPVLVCQVAYQTVTKDMKLRMPRFRGLRTDKAAEECTLDQIIPKDLQEYVSKRDFKSTPEPLGSKREGESATFVVQEHNAKRLHYDLRLEKDGVLKSWAVPKGIPMQSGEKRLAVHTEDHPLDYSEFEGTIPPGQYGAGTVKTWDKGKYELKVWTEDKIEFTLNGKHLQGRYVLAKFRKTGEKNWLLLKARD